MQYSLFFLLMPSLLWGADSKFTFTEADFKKYSHVQLTWWSFKVYKAGIWTINGDEPDLDKPIILHINYQRNIKAERLISTTLEEWERLKLLSSKSKSWLKQLKKIWPDVKKGDSLTTFSNNGVTKFYNNNKFVGKITDKDFGPLFLQIWLHKDSKTPELRKRIK